MKYLLKAVFTAIMLMFILCVKAGENKEIMFLSKQHCMLRLDTSKGRYAMLPVEEKAEVCNLKLTQNGTVVKTINVRMAVDNIDYYVPLDLTAYGRDAFLLDVHIGNTERQNGALRDYVCWHSIKYSDTLNTVNHERLRPVFHHTPEWGWMNDPNGLFYKDGLWHLYYQWNPYGSQWENMHWGHSVSRDLVHWESQGEAIAPDALGTVFSGCCVVDHGGTAGFGKGAVVSLYTAAGESQTQCMAVSTDGGRSFTKYEGNPVLTSDISDFRDPHIFWNDKIKQWNMILAAGQEMRIYTSADLKEWKYESSFGTGRGSHDGVWECPDLMQLPVEGTGMNKWLLICNINPGGPAGGSATQYFTGDFDGRTFKCDTAPEDTLWMDYGKDHYATVTFDNAPEGRRVAIGWMSNWQYANQTPTMQFRGANTIARELFLFNENGRTLAGSRPVREMLSMRNKPAVKTSFKAGRKYFNKIFTTPRGAYEVVVKLDAKKGERFILTLSNVKGENVSLIYEEAKGLLTMDRTASGDSSFSEFFPVVTKAPVYGGRLNELRLFIDRSSVEVFCNDGRTIMTNTVFPTEPYNSLTVTGIKGSKVKNLTVFGF